MTAKVFFIVEDEPETANDNCSFLKRVEPDARCVIAQNSEEAKKRLTLERPDLILVDLQYANTKVFPKEKLGLELLEHILAKYKQLNVMVYTTNPESLTPIIELIKEHKGGFGVSNKREGRSEFIECASALLKHQGTKIIPRDLIVNYCAEATERQKEMLQLVCLKGYSYKTVAKKLNLRCKEDVQSEMSKIRYSWCFGCIEREITDRTFICNKARELGII